MDLQGFARLFADDGVIHAGEKTFRGEELTYVVKFLAKLAPDAHRELHRVHVIGNVVAVELSIRGTFTGTFDSPAGVIHGERSQTRRSNRRLLVRGKGRIKEFNCYVGVSIMLQQMGIQSDFASVVKAQAAR
jgi:hypothetical protein